MNHTSPVADLVVEANGQAGQPILLNGSSSAAPTGTLKRFVFDPGDGSAPITVKESQVEHVYAEAGTFTVSLTVFDNRGNSATDTQVVEILPATIPDPEPVDCVLGQWRLESAGAWSDCVNGSQSREEVWARDILVEPAHGGMACGPTSEARVVSRTCTVAEDPVPVPEPDPDPNPEKYPDYTALASHPARVAAYHFRTQQNIDSIRSRAEGENKIPVAFDSAQDAALFQIDPSASLPHSGSTGTPQKRVPIGIQGATSMFLTWDLKIAASMAWKPLTELRVINGETVKVTYLDQHKSHRLDTRGSEPWIGLKQNYAKAGNRGLGVAEYFFSARLSHRLCKSPPGPLEGGGCPP